MDRDSHISKGLPPAPPLAVSCLENRRMLGLGRGDREKLPIGWVIDDTVLRRRKFFEIRPVLSFGRKPDARNTLPGPFVRQQPLQKDVARTGLPTRMEMRSILSHDESTVIDEQVAAFHDRLKRLRTCDDTGRQGCCIPAV